MFSQAVNSMFQTAFILFMFVASGVLGYWAQERDEPIQILREEIENLDVHPGEILRVRYEIIRKKNCSVRLEQVLFDAQRTRFILPENEYTAAPGGVGEDTFVIPVEVPEKMGAGRASYRAVRSYICNPLQRFLNWPVIVVAQDVSFNVTSVPKEFRP